MLHFLSGLGWGLLPATCLGLKPHLTCSVFSYKSIDNWSYQYLAVGFLHLAPCPKWSFINLSTWLWVGAWVERKCPLLLKRSWGREGYPPAEAELHLQALLRSLPLQHQSSPLAPCSWETVVPWDGSPQSGSRHGIGLECNVDHWVRKGPLLPWGGTL